MSYPYEYLGNLTFWDKKFKTVPKEMQPDITRHEHLEKKKLLKLVSEGDVALLMTNGVILHASSERAGELVSEGEIVYIPWGGRPGVHYYKGRFVSGENRIAHVRNPSQLNAKYLYYALLSEMDEISECYRGGSLKHPDMNMLLHIKIPVPPMELQNKAVEMLDAFELLISELDRETELRTRQFEMCRERLFSVNELNPLYSAMKGRMTRTELKKIVKLQNGKDRKAKGTLPVYGSGGIIANDGECLSSEPTVIIPRKGSISNLFYSEEPCFCINTVFYTEFLTDNVLPKYLFYLLQNMHLEQYNTSGSVPTLTKKVLQSLTVPYPPVDVQERTVEILDALAPENACSAVEEEKTERKRQFELCLKRLVKKEK